MTARAIAILSFLIAGRLSFAGDVTYQETTKITGGSITSMMKFAGAFSKGARKLGQPVVTTVAVKGNKMLRSTDDSAQIIDLDAQTITHIDKVKHEYSVITFAQMKAAADRAMEKARSEQSKATSQAPGPAPAKDPNVQLNFDAHVRETGAARQVSGLATKEVVLTVTVNGTDKGTGQQGALGVTNDMWMASDVPAYDVVREFDRKFAVAMGTTFTASPEITSLVQQAQSSDALKAMAKEMSQVHGVPVLQVMRMGMTTDGKPLPAASEAPLPEQSAGPGIGDAIGAEVTKTATDAAQQTAAQEASQRVRGALGNSLGSAIGGFGGFGRKKKQTASPETPSSTASAAQPSSAAPTQSAVLIESVTEMGNFAQAVDSAVMEVPSGFKSVTAPELK